MFELWKGHAMTMWQRQVIVSIVIVTIASGVAATAPLLAQPTTQPAQPAPQQPAPSQPAPQHPPQPPQQPPTTQEAPTGAAALGVDPVLGLTVVQVALIVAAMGLFGVVIGGGITYFVQTFLDNNRREVTEQRVAYALLVQVTAFATGTKIALDRITSSLGETALPQPNKALSEAMRKGEIPIPAAWCVLIASAIDGDKAFRSNVGSLIGLFADTTASFNESLTAMQIGGKDFADFPKPVIAAHAAAVKEIAGCKGAFKSLAGALADENVSGEVLGQLALGTWESMKRVSSSLEALRVSVIEPAKVSAAEAQAMHAQFAAAAQAQNEAGLASNFGYNRAVELINAAIYGRSGATGPTG
jgi:hypothetical protein